jgi:DNA transposition AAA+ family ATPase
MNRPPVPFIETLQYRRFAAFCEACRRNRCVGLCLGQSGVGKTFSARHYANWDKVSSYMRFMASRGVKLREVIGSTVVFYTPPITCRPGQEGGGIHKLRHNLRSFLSEALYRQKDARFKNIMLSEERGRERLMAMKHTTYSMFQELSDRTCKRLRDLHAEYYRLQNETEDPTELVIIDEAEWLNLATQGDTILSYVCRDVGVVLLGRPELESTVMRSLQLSSHIGLVHTQLPLSEPELRDMLKAGTRSIGLPGVTRGGLDETAIAAIARITGGNFRQLRRLQQQIHDLLEATGEKRLTRAIIEEAGANLVLRT